MEAHFLDIILTVVVLSFWFVFPIGMFLSVSHVEKNTDQIVRLDQLRHASTPEKTSKKKTGQRPQGKGRGRDWQVSYHH